MKQVGRRAPAETLGSAVHGLLETTRITATAVSLAGGLCPLPKGVYRFKSHEEANRWQERHQAALMSDLARKRGHG